MTAMSQSRCLDVCCYLTSSSSHDSQSCPLGHTSPPPRPSLSASSSAFHAVDDIYL